MNALAQLLLCAPLALAAVIPRTTVSSGYCAFSLQNASGGPAVQQNEQSGLLYLGAGQASNLYWINLSNEAKVLYDEHWNACIITWDGFLQCLDGTPGLSTWTLAKAAGGVLLAHDGVSQFTVCPNPQGAGQILKYESSPAAGCASIQLKATGLQGACSSVA